MRRHGVIDDAVPTRHHPSGRPAHLRHPGCTVSAPSSPTLLAVALLGLLAGCPLRPGTDAAITVDAAAPEADLDAPSLDALSADVTDVATDRPRIDDFVFNDVIDETDHDAGGGMQTGTLVGGTGALPGVIVGLRYSSGTVSDLTDATGMFRYTPGATITFQIADVTFRAARGRWLLSPFQLVGAGACTHSTELEKALVLVYSLDADGDPTNGIALPAYPSVPAARTLSSLSMADVATLVGQLIPGRVLLAPEVAADLFVHTIDDEAWAQVGADAFPILVSASRGQGVATDGVHVFFSSTNALERTDPTFRREAVVYGAIPPVLANAGSNHIGDIDVWNGSLYAPLENGPTYDHPLVVLYDPQTLQAGAVFPIPASLLTQGVPWVAVNGPASELYLAEWDPTPRLEVFSLSTVTHLRSLPLRPVLGRVQGAKMFDGSLYMQVDPATKAVFKINLETGTALHLFDLPSSSEAEGLAFFMRADGSQMHTLDVLASRLGVELRHHRRTRDPLRRAVCP